MVISTIGFGQSVSTGIKVGLNFATVGGEYTNGLDLQSITAFNAGVFAKFDLLDLLALQPELLYTMKGYKLAETSIPMFGNISVTGNISYLEIPVLLKLRIPFSSFGIIKTNIFAGPEVAFKLSAKAKNEINGQPSQTQDIPNTNSTDFGVIFGAGADIDLPITTIMIDVRYDLGLRTLDSSQNPSDIKNRVISINAGIGI